MALRLQVAETCAGETRPINWRCNVLHYALIFFLIAIAAAVLGFGGVSAASAGIAKILFFLFLVLFVVALLYGLITGKNPPGGPVA